ncbi:MAG: ATP synthase subunit I [Pseudomonadota bacterium]|nr:ATP synthase subunit I [Pseudomonadota bacterium]
MSQPSPLVDRRLAQRLSILQLLMVPVVALLAWIIIDAVAAKSAALGAGIGWIGSAYFAWQAFRHSGARASRSILGGFYRGMIGKFVLVTLGFALVFSSVQPLSAASVLMGFAMVHLMAWVYPLWINRTI